MVTTDSRRSRFERVRALLENADATPPPSPDGFRHAAVALALRARADELSVLLMRRVDDEQDRWSGQVSLPGGHAETGDGDLLATAVRETREEVGVDLDASSELLGRLAALQARARGGLLQTWIHPLVFGLQREVSPSPGPEASETFWFPLERARSGELDDTYHYTEPGLVRELPCWSIEGRVVWGLTHRILSEFLRRAGAAE